MTESRSELTAEQSIMGIKALSAEIQSLSDDNQIKEQKRAQLKKLVKHFWEVVKNNAVISEKLNKNNYEREVTFVYKGEQRQLAGDFLKPGEKSILEQIPGTDIYSFSKVLVDNLRTEFIFLKDVNDDREFDNKWENERFILSMPDARPQPYVPDRESSKLELKEMEQKGRFFKFSINEEGPYKGREYWVHLPKDFDLKQKPPYSLLLCLDGQEYHTHIPTPSIMDKMIEAKKIKPTITVLLANKGTKDRFDEYNCDTEFADFLANKFIPKLQAQYNVSKDAKDVSIAGSSMGGLGAIYAGLTHPEVIGNVISLSGSLWKCDVVTPSEKYKTTTHQRLQTAIDNFPSKSYELIIEMKVGSFENEDWARPNETNKVGKEGKCRSMLNANHDIANQLNKIEGIKAECREYPGGHNDACWRGLLCESLTHEPYQEKIHKESKTENIEQSTTFKKSNI